MRIELEKPSLCKGFFETEGFHPDYCEPTVDSLVLAWQRGARVIIPEIESNIPEIPGTAEILRSDIRTKIMYLIWDPEVKKKYGYNPVIVLPAGNRPCEAHVKKKNVTKDDVERYKSCLPNFPNGKDIRQGVYDRRDYFINSTVRSSHDRTPRFPYPQKEASVYPEITINQGVHRCFSTYTISSNPCAQHFHGNGHGFWDAA